MLAVSWTEFEKHGCVNCGCDYCFGTGMSGGGASPVRCGECDAFFVVLANGVNQSAIGFGDPAVYPILQRHPRFGISKHPYVRPDIRPDEGEYWSPRGVGVGRDGPDCSGFVKSRQAGERIVEMFRKALGRTPNTWLDYRPHEPTWIQVKVQGSDVDLEVLYELTRGDGIITEEKIRAALG